MLVWSSHPQSLSALPMLHAGLSSEYCARLLLLLATQICTPDSLIDMSLASCCCDSTVHASVGKPVKTKSRLGRSRPTSHDLPDVDPELDPSAGNDPLFDPASEALPVSRPHQTAPRTQGRTASSSLAKKYGALFIWGQLSGWFKQTVYDPTASLSAERRGTLSLPDPDSCYGSGRQYTLKVTRQASAHVPRRLIIASTTVCTV